MGGSGSGASYYHWWRPAKKTTVEACRSLDASRWMREGILKAGVWHTGSWCWFQDEARTKRSADITYEVNTLATPPWLRLHYTFKATGDVVDYRMLLATTRPRFGGVRWWFICPLVVGGRSCGRRVGKLYLPPDERYFGCRHCYKLTYTTCQESHKYDGFYRRLAKDIGSDMRTVKEVMNRIGNRT
jgi:hypothetical protein